MKTAVRLLTATAVACMALSTPAQTLRLRGTIDSAAGGVLDIRFSDGAKARLVLAPNATVVAVVKASMAEIKEGTFLGSAARPQPDGTLRALEVHIFPEQMRGVGEGHRPYAPVPQATMTNGATSGQAVLGVEGSTITVKYKDGEQKIVVPPDVPVVRYEVGTLADLRPGAAFTAAAATTRPDGSYETQRINVGRDGLAPQ